jgi:hypothetical protein
MMKKRSIRLTSLALSLFVAGAALYTGCSQKQVAATVSGSTAIYSADPNLNPLGNLPIAKEKVSLRIGIESQANVEDFETNWMTAQLEERGNFDLSFEVYPSEDRLQKV